MYRGSAHKNEIPFIIILLPVDVDGKWRFLLDCGKSLSQKNTMFYSKEEGLVVKKGNLLLAVVKSEKMSISWA